jgi:drug/metabolite transporter (DMT)-like permease
MTWLILALGAAVSVALKNVWTRSFSESIEQPTMVLGLFFFTGVCGIVYVAVTGIPSIQPDFYWIVAAGAIIDAVAITLLIRTIFMSDLADVYPLVALTPAFTALTSFILLGERPSPLGIAGVIVIVVGAYLMRVEGAKESILKPFRLLFRDAGARYMMLTAFLFSLMGPLFKRAMEASSAGFALTSTQWLTTLILGSIYLMQGRLKDTLKEIRRHFWGLAGLGVTNFLQAILTFLAMRIALVAYVAGVKRLGILFTVLFGYLAFKERGALRGAIAGAVMFVGVILIYIA